MNKWLQAFVLAWITIGATALLLLIIHLLTTYVHLWAALALLLVVALTLTMRVIIEAYEL